MPDSGKISSPSLAHLFLAFFRLGLTAFGGPAMLVYIRNLAVDDRKWIDPESFREGVALCQIVPGATAMQTAAYVGMRVRGIAGAAACFIGFGLPAFFLMIALSAFYRNTRDLKTFLSMFGGLHVIIVALVGNAAFSFGKTNLKDRKGILIAIVVGIGFALGVNPCLVILLAALLGTVLYRNRIFPAPPSRNRTIMKFSWTPLIILGVYLIGLAFLLGIDRQLFDLTTVMSKVDLMAFGGGFASLPLMEREIVGVRSWLVNSVFMDGIALGQITPGPIVITAAFVGFWIRGWTGAALGTVGIFMPSFLMVVGVIPHFDQMRRHANFNRAIEGILSSLVALLIFVTFRFAQAVPWDIPRLLILGGAAAALIRKQDVLRIILIGGVISAFIL